MNINRLISQKSSSLEAMKKTNILSVSNGGVTQDFSTNVENIREISRKMGTDILPTITTRNLLKYSEEFDNPYWGKANVTVTPDNTVSPFGTNSADKMVSSSGSSVVHYVSTAISVVNGNMYTLSIYAKAAEYSGLTLVLTSNGFNTSIFGSFDLLTGTCSFSTPYGVASNVSVTAKSVGNGWYRCSLSALSTSTNNSSAFQVRSQVSYVGGDITYIGDGVSGIYLSGVQLERNSNPTAYQPTKEVQTNLEITSANFLFVPSSYSEGKIFSQNPTLRNLVKYSEEISNTLAWFSNQMTISVDSTAAPDGKTSADKLIPSTSALQHYVTSQGFNVPINTTYTVSFYAKSAGYNFITFASPDGNVCINLSNGTVSSSSAGFPTTIVLDNNGFYRISIVYTINISSMYFSCSPTDSLTIWQGAGDGISGVYLWGIQVEKGTIATPYQRTTDAISDFTFTRATVSRVINEEGIIEDSCYNLVQRSQEFDNAIWSKVEAAITPNATTAPNGTLTAASVISSTVASHHRVLQAPVAIGEIVNLSIYAKPNGYNYIWLGISPAGSEGTFFNLSNGTFIGQGTNVTNSKIEQAENGFYRCSVSIRALFVNTTLDVYVRESVAFGQVGDGVSGVYLWGAQLSKGSTPRPYLKTTNRLNVPKLDYSLNLLEPSLLIEPTRTNLLTKSEEFNAWGSDIPMTTIVDIILAPNNTTTADKITENTVSLNYQDKYLSTTFTAGQIYTYSIFVKAAERNFFRIGLITGGFGNGGSCIFDLNTGVKIGTEVTHGTATNVASTINSAGNGWYRCTITAIFPSTVTAYCINFIMQNSTTSQYIGTADYGLYMWGGQLEIGSNATTYIPTTTATVTRNADTSYVDLFNNNMLNQNNFTLYCEGYLYSSAASDIGIILSDTTSYGNNAIGWYNGIVPFYRVGGTITDSGLNIPSNTYYKLIIQINGTTVKIFRNGSQIWTTQTVPVFNYQYLVIRGASTYTVDKIALFNRTLTDLECINLVSVTNNNFESLASASTYTLIT